MIHSNPHFFFGKAVTFGFVCGLVEFVMGLLNLGLLVKFVSQPVISAFSTAVAFQVPLILTNMIVSKYLFFFSIRKCQICGFYAGQFSCPALFLLLFIFVIL
jgi:MFS superfamily sulfate permease-like transporter